MRAPQRSVLSFPIFKNRNNDSAELLWGLSELTDKALGQRLLTQRISYSKDDQILSLALCGGSGFSSWTASPLQAESGRPPSLISPAQPSTRWHAERRHGAEMHRNKQAPRAEGELGSIWDVWKPGSPRGYVCVVARTGDDPSGTGIVPLISPSPVHPLSS